MSKLQVSRLLMISAILLILGFQVYWLHKLYMEEAAGFKKTTDIVFRETMYKVQAQRLKKDSLFYKIIPEENNFMGDVAELVSQKLPQIKFNTGRAESQNEMTISMNTDAPDVDAGNDSDKTNNANFQMQFNDPDPDGNDMPGDSLFKKNASIVFRKISDSAHRRSGKFTNINITRMIQAGIDQARRELQDKKIVFHNNGGIEKFSPLPPKPHFRHRLAAQDVLVKSRTLNDTISVAQIDSAYKKALAVNNINTPFQIRKDSLFRPDSVTEKNFNTSKVPVGFLNKNAYQASFEPPTVFLLGKIAPQVLLSLFLVAFTAITFLFLYRNLVTQRRLTMMKNDFISNITHELKTPIATVNVAIEALRNFNALQSPEKTKEYLDISASELQRLSLLVDKVLKLSMFENKDIELKKESFDLKVLIEEVMHSMRLQFEKQKANISFKTAGASFILTADRLHTTSVIYNLLDNALKYSKESPEIRIELASLPDELLLRVSDNGIGIAPDYAGKIFDKFFRVPSGDHHNIKGYGLGLSYAAQVVSKHNGSIALESEPGKGSTFIVKLPLA